MYVLDTDHVSLVEWGSGADAQRLRSRLQRTPRKDVASTIVSYEERSNVPPNDKQPRHAHPRAIAAHRCVEDLELRPERTSPRNSWHPCTPARAHYNPRP